MSSLFSVLSASSFTLSAGIEMGICSSTSMSIVLDPFEVYWVDDEGFFHCDVFDFYFIACASLCEDCSCFSMEAGVIKSFVNAWLGNKAYFFTLFEGLEVVC